MDAAAEAEMTASGRGQVDFVWRGSIAALPVGRGHADVNFRSLRDGDSDDLDVLGGPPGNHWRGQLESEDFFDEGSDQGWIVDDGAPQVGTSCQVVHRETDGTGGGG